MLQYIYVHEIMYLHTPKLYYHMSQVSVDIAIFFWYNNTEKVSITNSSNRTYYQFKIYPTLNRPQRSAKKHLFFFLNMQSLLVPETFKKSR